MSLQKSEIISGKSTDNVHCIKCCVVHPPKSIWSFTAVGFFWQLMVISND